MACCRAFLSTPAATPFHFPASRYRHSSIYTPRPSHISPRTLSLSLPPHPRPLRPLRCSSSSDADSPQPIVKQADDVFRDWDLLTSRFAGASNLPFLLLQLPQIMLNTRNLLTGNKSALFALPWLGMLTGLLGNLSLLSYFAKKRETGAVLVQMLGGLSTLAVITQLAMAEAMPLPHFMVTSAVVGCGLVVNLLSYFGWLPEGWWGLWEDFITVAGLSVLPQVMWSTFVPFIPDSILPGIISCLAAVAAVVMARTKKFSEKGIKIGSLSGWTATLLFMWMPIAQMWTNFLNPDNIRGLSAITMLLGMIGNALMIPRALFIRDLMWFLGASWASCLHGWGNLLCMYCFRSISNEFFWGATCTLYIWLGMALWRDMMVYGYHTPVKSFEELASRKQP